MKIKVLAAIALLCSGLALAQTDTSAAPTITKEQQAQMDAWMKAMTPGAEHKMLESMAGTWNTRVKSWMAPGGSPMESTGTAENKVILGGRYVQTSFEGNFMGMPFSGIGYTGYDNIRKQYVSTWMDNMSTAVMITNGKWDDATKSLVFTGTMDDPMTGKAQSLKETVRVVDNDTHIMEMWGPGPDGAMFKMMEITYSRKK